MRGRMLQPGDMALTDYNGPGPITKVEILERDDNRLHGHSQSGVMFRVRPILRNGTNASWYDADWFEPVPANATSHRSAACGASGGLPG